MALSPDRIVVGNGSTELIDVMPRALSIRSAVIVGPTYAEYVRAVRHAGGRISHGDGEERRGVPSSARAGPTSIVETATSPAGDRCGLYLSSQ
jgi:histidinol-phosphate/aromatic aminotransferase/cobyric acid decarboxylase-like protein